MLESENRVKVKLQLFTDNFKSSNTINVVGRLFKYYHSPSLQSGGLAIASRHGSSFTV